MKTYEIAPGSLLQRLFLKERLSIHSNDIQRFIELGSGNGYNSHLLLSKGWSGTGIDLNGGACENNRALNVSYVSQGKYEVLNTDFFSFQPLLMADLLFSCMVVEHFSADQEHAYFEKARELVRPGGYLITMVPGSMAHWGIEDEIAGHRKRYTRKCLKDIAQLHRMELVKLSGLTYPVSNWLLPISNRVVARSESAKKDLRPHEQTVLSGNRKVMFKTDYPYWMKLILNEVTMYPFHLLQKLAGNSERALILYAEMKVV